MEKLEHSRVKQAGASSVARVKLAEMLDQECMRQPINAGELLSMHPQVIIARLIIQVFFGADSKCT